MASAAAGYSPTPLAAKLGLKDGQSVVFVGLPDALGDLATARDFAVKTLTDWPALGEAGGGHDVVHAFTRRRADLDDNVGTFKKMIAPDGAVWISWPKKASKIATDITEDVIRDVALPEGLVDVKVCAVDAVWSGLKLVIRKELRQAVRNRSWSN
ncbi:hypothetical protein ASC75_05835 [Aminobacter sp. DSM 101952]|uniref:DUF3052 family protein n=1 Tax=Aminobacter sp. DSM 101952 TaxID=2735891 RepID=UPI0006FDEB3C|nr:DUF3052 family protein [Aminobacter sp. DSM 101952]KQU73168.1 hypothetical protein ASC75_05835 [Aminobacter sp. DSM 101952]